jgi:hypothetical protein
LIESVAINAPRFDYNPTTFESLGLLVEEQRTNLLTYSEQFNDAVWLKSNSSITANTVVAPDGTLTGDKLVANTTNTVHSGLQITSITSGVSYTFSIYAKAGEQSFVAVRGDSAGGLLGAAVYFSLTNGSVTQSASGVTATSVSVGNGWYRLSVTATASASTANARPTVYLSNAGTGPAFGVSFAGNDFDGIYIWGAQLEAGAFATSYIPTVASQVTRAADSAVMTGTNFSSWYNQAEGTLFGEFSTIFSGSASININPGLFAITDSGSGAYNGYSSRLVPSGTSSIRWGSRQGATTQEITTAFTGLLQAGSTYKNAGAYASNLLAQSVNGGAAVQTTDSNYGLMTLNRFEIGFQRIGGTNTALNGHVRRIAYYPRRLANSELQGITS